MTTKEDYLAYKILGEPDLSYPSIWTGLLREVWSYGNKTISIYRTSDYEVQACECWESGRAREYDDDDEWLDSWELTESYLKDLKSWLNV